MEVAKLSDQERSQHIQYQIQRTIEQKGEEAGATQLVWSLILQRTNVRTAQTLTNSVGIQRDEIRNAVQIIIRTTGDVDQETIQLTHKIPYHAWGGAINEAGIALHGKIMQADIGTLLCLCLEFLHKDDNYWNDDRERDFSGISKAIHERATILGYVFQGTIPRFYMNDTGKKRFDIPNPLSINHLQ